LRRLLRSLRTEPSSFFLHVDRKSDTCVFEQIADELRDIPNVQFLKRHACYWGGFGHVAATLEGINVLSHSRSDFDYAVLLTGQDYPIKSPSQIAAFFQEHQGKLFLDNFSLPSDEWTNGGMDRVRFWYLRLFQRPVRFPPAPSPLPRRTPPKGLKLFGGSSYWCLTRECVEYVSQFVSERHNVVRYFRYVDVPDELFFQTIVMNSPFRDAVINDNLRYIDWKDPDAGSPAVLTKADFPALATSSKLFARKFDIGVDARVLDLIDEELLAAS